MRTEFGLEAQGIRFPTRVRILRTQLATQRSGEGLHRSTVSEVEQLYDNYEFFVVHTGEIEVLATEPD